jgi:hypothetical protein
MWLADFLELLPPHLVIHRLTGDPHPEELVAPDWCRAQIPGAGRHPGGTEPAGAAARGASTEVSWGG